MSAVAGRTHNYYESFTMDVCQITETDKDKTTLWFPFMSAGLVTVWYIIVLQITLTQFLPISGWYQLLNVFDLLEIKDPREKKQMCLTFLR